MEKCKQFCLTGYGVVQDLNFIEEAPTLRIQVASLSPDASESLKDDIIICCTAPIRLKKRLQYLDRQYPTIEGVTAWFQVRFGRIAHCQAKKTTPRSPHHLVLTGELLAIEHWLRDGTHSV